jgi:GTP-binding protein Era
MNQHKAGFVNIIGKPNVGKSTLMNALLGEKLSIITNKAQTTRHRILGLANGTDYQMVFSDSPGILDPKYKLHERMMNFVDESLSDADIILFVIETGDQLRESEHESKYYNVIDKLSKINVPVILVLNKIDKIQPEEISKHEEYWKSQISFAEIIPVSATQFIGVDKLLYRLLDLLPESPPYFDKDSISDKPLRFFAAEILREKIFLNYKKEIPYSCEVEIEEYKESDTIDHIKAVINVERESQKPILIGNKGLALKNTATQARKDLEEFLGKKVYLEVFVKVKDNWRSNENQLKRFGY